MDGATDTAEAFCLNLPTPTCELGSSLFVALQQRQTIRDIASAQLSPQQLSDLLWSACGVNRKTGAFGAPGRTAASASNSQEIDVYLALERGVFLYDAFAHRLALVAETDLRAQALTPGQAGVAPTGPAHLIYVVDLDRLTQTKGFDEPGLHDPEVQKAYYYVDTGLIAQNVYLFAASHGLAAWFHNCDRPGLARGLGLGERQQVLFAQSVGYPARGG